MSEESRKIFRTKIKGSVEAIWRELTKTDSPQQAVFNGLLVNTGFHAGAAVQMRTADASRTLVVGEVVEYDPPRRYAHTFRFTRFDDAPCVVIYDLVPQADGLVEVTLTVDNMPLGTETAKQMTWGGDFILANLKSIVETGKPPFGTRIMYAIFGALGFVLPKRTLAANWPLQDRNAA
ncbi:SRPBCC domain-containing protein [Niveispirillum sp. KHB5.9]|uniref:SRPBCC domain-containing protein n=1 Tax=Niveispirillum sp. KHB5.9 TaxID=3400269 RepID=UPI003A842E25